MRQAHLMLVSGLPGTGKSTLARLLAQHYALPLICKDTIKEPLFDVIGAADRIESRRLSDASFAAMFALARDCLGAGADLILEGNFRPRQHESALVTAAGSNNPRVAQILCRASEPVRIARLKARAIDPSRHPGHRDASFVQDPAPAPSEFLDIPGMRLVLDGDGLSAADTHDRRVLDLLDALDRWRREA